MKMNAVYTASVISVLLIHFINGAPTDLKKQRRDEEGAVLKRKLNKLRLLLDKLDDEDLLEARSSASSEDSAAAPTTGPPVTSADVPHNQKTGDTDSGELQGLEQVQQRQNLEPNVAEKPTVIPKEDDSVIIKKLARVLARLPSPKYAWSDNSEPTPELTEKEFEEVVSQALENMSRQHQSRGLEGRNQDLSRRYEELRRRRLHDEDLNAVEVRLIKDLQTAKDMGVSVREVIDDLEAKDIEDGEIQEGRRRFGGFRPFRPY